MRYCYENVVYPSLWNVPSPIWPILCLRGRKTLHNPILPETLVDCDHIQWDSRKVISQINRVIHPLLRIVTTSESSKGNFVKLGENYGGIGVGKNVFSLSSWDRELVTYRKPPTAGLMITWSMTSRDPKRSRSWPPNVSGLISRKPCEMQGWCQWTTRCGSHGHVGDDYTSRSQRTCTVTRICSTFGDRAFTAAGSGLWNSLQSHLIVQ